MPHASDRPDRPDPSTAARAAALRRESRALIGEAATHLTLLRLRHGRGGGDVAERLSDVRARLRALVDEAADFARRTHLTRDDVLECPALDGVDHDTRDDVLVLCEEAGRWFDAARDA